MLPEYEVGGIVVPAKKLSASGPGYWEFTPSRRAS